MCLQNRPKCKQRRPIASSQPYLPYGDYPCPYSSVFACRAKKWNMLLAWTLLLLPLSLKLTVVANVDVRVIVAVEIK